MKVHVVVSELVLRNADAVEDLLGRLRNIGLQSLDTRRLERFGILSGELGECDVATVRSVDGVDAVEADGIKYAT